MTSLTWTILALNAIGGMIKFEELCRGKYPQSTTVRGAMFSILFNLIFCIWALFALGVIYAR